MRDALTAKRTIGILDNTVARNIHRCAAACPCQIPDIQRLHLIANLDAAHTFDTFIHIPIERKCFCPRTAQPLLQLCFKGKLKDTQIIRNLLQLTVAAAYTGRTFAVMLRQNQFYICAGVSFWHEGNSYTPPCHPLQGCCRLQPSRARPQFPHSRYGRRKFH